MTYHNKSHTIPCFIIYAYNYFRMANDAYTRLDEAEHVEAVMYGPRGV